MTDRLTIAEHEVAHGVMRWLLRLPATGLHCSDEGGLCEGTGGRVQADDAVVLTLAGFAYESGCGMLGLPGLENLHDADFDEARELLAACESLKVTVSDDGGPIVESPEKALERWFLRAGEMLFPHIDFIQRVGWILEDAGHVSARRFGALLREYGKTLARAE